MATINQICKVIVKDSIDHEYVAEANCELPAIYKAEYGSFNGTSPKACMGYLMGLPSVCTVPFYNGEILELLAAQGVSRKTELGQENLIALYWLACGNAFYNLIK
jgi:hypothetical protein